MGANALANANDCRIVGNTNNILVVIIGCQNTRDVGAVIVP